MKVRTKAFFLVCAGLIPPGVHAYHGVAGIGGASLEGPGAPIESSASATLPQGSVLGYLKLDHVRYKIFDSDPAAPESRYANFGIAGLGYGFTPWLSVYIFAPYQAKIDEPGGFTTRGFADISIIGQLGFKYDQGMQLTPANESVDDLEDWHFTIYGGPSIPTGDPNLRDAGGNIDPGKSTGFGKPSFTFGVTAAKLLSPKWTSSIELSHLRYQEYQYDDGVKTRFGAEYRVNGALNYRVHTNAAQKLRVDLVGEVQYLHLGRDSTNSEADAATGGSIVYAVAGIQTYWDKVSIAFGIKTPVWTKLNEESQQQGAEGKERYRALFTVSTLFD